MHYNIDFPHLGIRFDHVGKTISIGSFDIAYYGIVIALGIVLGMSLAFAYAKHRGESVNDYENMLILGIILGVIGARIYYVAFMWDQYRGDLKSIFNTREGGLAIYGGVIGAFLAVLIYTRIKKIPFLKAADPVAIGFAAGQMVGRWGNFFNREAFGEYTDSLFAMRLPVDAVRSGDITDKMRAHMETVDGVRTIQVHPTFLYESCWCLLLLIVLLTIAYRGKNLFYGQIFFTYLCGYGLGRVWIEGLRTDQLKLHGIAVSQVLSGLLVIVSLTVLVISSRRRHS